MSGVSGPGGSSKSVTNPLLIATVVLLSFLTLVALASIIFASALVVPHYSKLVQMIQQSELVMCCISNLCELPLVNYRQCAVPPATMPPATMPPAKMPPAKMPPTEMPPTEMPPTEMPPTKIPLTSTSRFLPMSAALPKHGVE